MLYEIASKDRAKLLPLFENTTDTLILSCLQGHMGQVWVNNVENPTVAQIKVGIFVFYGGDVNGAGVEELVKNLSENSLVIVHHDEWKAYIERIHEGCIKKIQRYAFKKNVEYLERNHIQSFLATIPEGYELKKIDREIANDSSFHHVSEDFQLQFETVDEYMRKGIGYCLLHNGQVVCAAWSYSVYDDGIEIQIDTHLDHRRKGLATVTAAALILDCLDRGVYPNWDAANMDSVHLAEKLGYVLDGAYDTYYIYFQLKCLTS